MDGKKILITGFSGFVARYFVEYLYSLEINVKIYGIDIQKPIYDIDCYRPRLDIHFQKLDMTDFNKLADLFQQFTPDYILHLAAYSSVRDVVKAYYILFMNGKSGEIYNICSGKGVTLKSMIELIGNQIGVWLKFIICACGGAKHNYNY